METIRVDVQVRDDHISKGIEGNCERCPAALALLEVVSDDVFVLVTSDEIEFVRKGTNRIVQTPLAVSDFIAAFDGPVDGNEVPGDVAPFTFSLDIPAEFVSDDDDVQDRLDATAAAYAGINQIGEGD